MYTPIHTNIPNYTLILLIHPHIPAINTKTHYYIYTPIHTNTHYSYVILVDTSLLSY